MKSILLGSIVATALVFGGCGSSSSKSSNTTPESNNSNPGTENNNTNPGTDNNGSNPGTDDNTSNDTVTIGNLVWTKFKKDNDDDPQNDGQISYSEAKTACDGMGMSLPTIEQIESNVSAVATKLGYESIRSGKDTSVVIFWDANKTKPVYYIDDANISDHDAQAFGNLIDVNNSAYYTCVKDKQ
jgi:cytoskeletal protein RodZ